MCHSFRFCGLKRGNWGICSTARCLQFVERWRDISLTELVSVQYMPSSHQDSSYFTTNSGAPVWNNNSSLTVGSRGELCCCCLRVLTGSV